MEFLSLTEAMWQMLSDPTIQLLWELIFMPANMWYQCCSSVWWWWWQLMMMRMTDQACAGLGQSPAPAQGLGKRRGRGGSWVSQRLLTLKNGAGSGVSALRSGRCGPRRHCRRWSDRAAALLAAPRAPALPVRAISQECPHWATGPARPPLLRSVPTGQATRQQKQRVPSRPTRSRCSHPTSLSASWSPAKNIFAHLVLGFLAQRAATTPWRVANELW